MALAAASVDKTLELLANFTFIAIGSYIVLVGQHLISEADLIALGLLSTLLLIPVAVLVAIWRGRHPIWALCSGWKSWRPCAGVCACARCPSSAACPTCIAWKQP